MLNEINDQEAENEKEIDRLKNFETDIKSGKNKKYARQDYKEVYEKSRKNLKNLHKILDYFMNQSFEYRSNIFSERDVSTEYLVGIHKNLDETQNIYRNLGDMVKDINKANDKLKRTIGEVKSGNNKEYVIDDFKDIYDDTRRINNEIMDLYEKNYKKKPIQRKPTINNQDPESYIAAVKKLNDNSHDILGDLGVYSTTNNNKLKDLQNFKDEVMSGKNKIGALDDLKRIYGENLENTRNLKRHLNLLEEKKPDEGTFFFEDEEEPYNPQDYIDRIEDLNKFQKKYIQKLKDRIKDLNDLLNQTLDENNKQKRELSEIEADKFRLEKENKQLKFEKDKSVDNSKLQKILKDSIQTRENLNKLLGILSDKEVADKFSYNTNEDSNKLLTVYIQENAKIIKFKSASIEPLLADQNKSDPNVLMNILKKLEKLKEFIIEFTEDNIDLEVDDNTRVDMQKASEPDLAIKYINNDINFTEELLDNLFNGIEEKINVLIRAKNEILNEKVKIKYQAEDLAKEINKKTALIGKLQVKMYMLMSVLENMESIHK